MPVFVNLGNWIGESAQGFYVWACNSAQGVGEFLQGVGNALIMK